MSFRKLFLATVLGAAIVAPQVEQMQAPLPPAAPLVGNIGIQERAPAYSSPQEKMHPNGDRVSHYPPYYHPDRSGGNR